MFAIRDEIESAEYVSWLRPLVRTYRNGAEGILSASASFDILWVSATEFVTRHKFTNDKKNSVQHLYSMEVYVD
jgi:hypothetical protein